jgi:hypothetical protein
MLVVGTGALGGVRWPGRSRSWEAKQEPELALGGCGGARARRQPGGRGPECVPGAWLGPAAPARRGACPEAKRLAAPGVEAEAERAVVAPVRRGEWQRAMAPASCSATSCVVTSCAATPCRHLPGLGMARWRGLDLKPSPTPPTHPRRFPGCRGQSRCHGSATTPARWLTPTRRGDTFSEGFPRNQSERPPGSIPVTGR